MPVVLVAMVGVGAGVWAWRAGARRIVRRRLARMVFSTMRVEPGWASAVWAFSCEI
jgi:hypothetical protein